MPLVKNSRYVPTTVNIIPCSCGRIRKSDMEDLMVVIEEDHTAYNGRLTFSPSSSKSVMVVCMREGCLGKWRTRSKYINKLPRIFGSEYAKLKRLM